MIKIEFPKKKPNLNVLSHLITYPILKEGDFMSLSLVKLQDVIETSRSWDMKSPFIKNMELFSSEDLTENELAIR
jgi:hypothetical protein